MPQNGKLNQLNKFFDQSLKNKLNQNKNQLSYQLTVYNIN